MKKHTLVFRMVVIGTHTNWKMQQKVVEQFFCTVLLLVGGQSGL